MPRNRLPRNLDGSLMELKFPDCELCVNVRKRRTCRECDSGEFFEEIEPEGVDEIMVFGR